jgi:hypothetical protein
VLRISGDLAQSLKVDVTGIVSRGADLVPFGEVYALGEFAQAWQRENPDLLHPAQKQLRHSLKGRGLALTWRESSDFESVAGYPPSRS